MVSDDWHRWLWLRLHMDCLTLWLTSLVGSSRFPNLPAEFQGTVAVINHLMSSHLVVWSPPYYPPSGCHLGVLVETRWDPSVIAVDPDDVDQLVNVLLAHVIEHYVIHVEEVSDGLILKPVSVAGLFDDVAQGRQTFAEQQSIASVYAALQRCLVQWDWKWPPGWSSIASLYEGFLSNLTAEIRLFFPAVSNNCPFSP